MPQKYWRAFLCLMLVIATYLIFWTALYVSIMGSNFSYAPEYMRWGFSGGEIPVYINMTAILATAIVWLLISAVVGYRRMSKSR